MHRLPLPIQTERLALRAFRTEDAEGLYGYLGDAEVAFFEPYDAFTLGQCKTEAERRAGDPRFIAICLLGKLIGNVYFEVAEDGETAEIGYVMNRAYWGSGYATEAARAVIEAAFAAGVKRVQAGCAEQNPHSWRLLMRLGMELVEKIPHCVTFKKDETGADIWLDARRYELKNPKV